MADVKWIKIVTDIFDDEKMLLIESMPEADSIIVIWFKLLCLAGKQNNGGVFLLNDKIAYTDEMLATVFRRPIATVRLALATFEKFGMIEISSNTYIIANWDKYQTLDKIEHKKEMDRIRIAEKRRQARLGMSRDSSATNCDSRTVEEEKKENEKENFTFTLQRERASEEIGGVDFQTKRSVKRISEIKDLTDEEFFIVFAGIKNALQLGCFIGPDFSFLASSLEDDLTKLRDHIAKGERNARLIERVIKDYAPKK